MAAINDPASSTPPALAFSWPRGLLIHLPQLQNHGYQYLPSVGRGHSLDLSFALSLTVSKQFFKPSKTTKGSLCQCESCGSWLHILAIKSNLQNHLAHPYTVLEFWASEHLSVGPVFFCLLNHLHSPLPSRVQLPWLAHFKWELGLMPHLWQFPI